jgi:hypothetical protein
MKRQNNFTDNQLNVELAESQADEPFRSYSTRPNFALNISQDCDSDSDSEENTCFKSRSHASYTPLFVPYQPKQFLSNQVSLDLDGSYRSTQSAERSIRIHKINFR